MRTVAQTVTTAVLTQVKGYTAAEATKWAAKAAEVQQVTTSTVTSITSNVTTAATVFGFAPTTNMANVDLTPRSNSLLVAATSTTTTVTTVAEKLAVVTDALGGAGTALSAQEAVSPMEDGTYSFAKTFGEDLFGTEIAGTANQTSTSGPSTASVRASAANNEGVAFVNSAGEVTNIIPGRNQTAADGTEIMPGFLTMLVVMKAGEVYEPIVYATNEALAAAGIETEEQEAAIPVTETTEEKKIVTVDENGQIVGEAETVKEADSEVLSAMASAIGMQASDLKNAMLVGGVTFPDYADATKKSSP